MAYVPKTASAPFDRSVWSDSLDPARRAEGLVLLDIFSETTGWEPRMWGPTMVGFGRYDYTYASGHSGSAMATGFAARRSELVLYVLSGHADAADLLARLGTHRTGTSCLYVKRLERIDQAILPGLIRRGLDGLARQWPVFPV